MAGVNYRISHKRADKEKWSSSEQSQRKLVADLLEQEALRAKEGIPFAEGPAAPGKRQQ